VTRSDACFTRYIYIFIFTRAGATARARAKARKRERDDEKESRDSFRCILRVIQIFVNVIFFFHLTDAQHSHESKSENSIRDQMHCIRDTYTFIFTRAGARARTRARARKRERDQEKESGES